MTDTKRVLIEIARITSIPVARLLPLESWSYWLGRVHDIKLIGKTKPNPTPSARGSANINIIAELVQRTFHLEGHVAECGVFRGATLVGLAYVLKRSGVPKRVLGFDSFQGFDERAVERDSELGDASYIEKESKLFKNASTDVVRRKLKLVGVSETVDLIPGYFNKTLKAYSSEKFSFVHLDCDLYEPYKECLSFFYPRLSKGGVVLFDEYNDPVYKGCDQAVNEFLSDRPENLRAICRDNQIKYYIQKH